MVVTGSCVQKNQNDNKIFSAQPGIPGFQNPFEPAFDVLYFKIDIQLKLVLNSCIETLL